MSITINFLPFTITVPGDYVLASDLSTSGHGIIVQSNDVTVDLNGHTISGSQEPTNAFYGISAFDCDNITITNGSVSGFRYGIYLSDRVDYAATGADLNGGGHLIDGVNISDSTFRGIRVEGQNNVVSHNTISNIGGATLKADSYAFGIESFGFNAVISGNTISEVRGSGYSDLGEGVGISISNFGDGTVISGNTISNVANEIDATYADWPAPSRSTWGIWIGGDGSSNIVVDGNTIENFIYGITFKRTVAGEFLNNTVTGAAAPYYRPYDADGTRVIDGGGNTSDFAADELAWGRYTPGQIESVEEVFLSPLPRTADLLFHPLHNPGDTADTLTGADGRMTMVDYWTAPSAVQVDLSQSTATGGGGNDVLVNILGVQGSKFSDVLRGNAMGNLLSGSDGDDMMYGGDGDDYLYGDDVIAGSSGSDSLFGGAGADYHYGGPSIDYARYDDAGYDGLTASLANPAGNTGAAAGDRYDSIEGLILTGNSDYGYGDGGINYLYGLAGNDVLYGNDGDDSLHGGEGSDMLSGGAGADLMDGENGFDYARYDDAGYAGLTASLADPAGNTGVAAGDAYASIEGLVLTGNNDYGYGNDAANYLYGMGGNDSLFGNGDADALHGGDGNDMLYGGAGGDVLEGGGGLDYARYNEASHAGLKASLASPALNSGVAAGDIYSGIEGLILTNNADYGYGDESANYLYGMSGNDWLYGNGGNDNLSGGEGNDMLFGGDGADRLDGGAGLDYARYNDAGHAGLTASLLSPAGNTGVAAGDTYAGIEGLILTDNADIGSGDNAANYLYGMSGDDALYGNGGNDKLYGGEGHDLLDGGNSDDTLYGGADADTFVFRSNAGCDLIADFEGGTGVYDCLDLRGEFSAFADVLAASTQIGEDLLISLGAGFELTLAGFYRGNFAADDVLL